MNAYLSESSLELAKKQAYMVWERNKSAIITGAIILTVVLLSIDMAEAARTTDEFSGTATKFESWIKGNLGKTIAFVSLIIGAGIAAFKKDGMALIFALFIAIGIGIIVGLINATFTALI
ncbi:TrbC/VirB2 family protein [Moraxella catarrhalis]|uniref:TrbC/VirB2 family protein n=1 Tax=Moraxella catarrhalis TaxID=480 RepID=UPI00128D6C83|nr:TrbC/VirB2 family protein [Moraxella catarrhalis]MPX68906.1 conjugal transfer protein TrbC [Moraxella catarrhalis]MPX85620.1 conjugal transfer protein TrbC [Moraxella catarrhalis]